MSDAPKHAQTQSHDSVVPLDILFPFALVTTLFALWGFANDVTNPLVKAFEQIFLISSSEGALVQTAFYGGYATMALPAAIFIRRFSYKAGILVGLGLYAIGAFLFIPASITEAFWLFLVALYVLTFGLAFLETTANPYMLAMGPASTATRRLNFAQAFNPIGSLVGMIVASQVVLVGLGVQEFGSEQTERIQEAHRRQYEENLAAYQADPNAYQRRLDEMEAELTAQKEKLETLAEGSEDYQEVQAAYKKGVLRLQDMRMPLEGDYQPMLPSRIDARVRTALEEYAKGEIDFDGNRNYESHAAMKAHDLRVVRLPYVVIGGVVVALFVVFAVSKLPGAGGDDRDIRFFETFGRLMRNGRYVGGVIAQMFYVGAQIMCWTYVIHYAMANANMSLSQAQLYNTVAMAIFCGSRFICTYLLKFVSPGGLLMGLALAAMPLTLGTIFVPGMIGLYCLIAISACMSLMFPTIYGIALDGLGEDAKLGSAGLIFAIVGGALAPRLQGQIVDLGDDFTGLIDLGFTSLPSANVSFVLPFLCFVVVAAYGFLTHSNILKKVT